MIRPFEGEEMDRSDEALYESFIKQNDEGAIRLLFDKYRELLIYYINGILHNIDDSEEIMMDCFAVVIAQTTRFSARRGSSFKTWLYAIATKRAYMFMRKNHVVENTDECEDIAADEFEIPEKILLKEEKHKGLYKAMNSLSADQRTVLYLKFFEDMSPEEISRVMKKSVRQVYKLTDKGKSRLRELLERSGMEGIAQWDM